MGNLGGTEGRRRRLRPRQPLGLASLSDLQQAGGGGSLSPGDRAALSPPLAAQQQQEAQGRALGEGPSQRGAGAEPQESAQPGQGTLGKALDDVVLNRDSENMGVTLCDVHLLPSDPQMVLWAKGPYSSHFTDE